MPSANPLTMITPFFESALEIWVAAARPSGEAFREPIIDTLGLGKGTSMGPTAKSSEGANLRSTSLRGPRSSLGTKVVIFGVPLDSISDTWDDLRTLL